jgi:(2Fe-2S) ferredoxin
MAGRSWLDEAAMRRIVDEHLCAGRVVEELVFHRLEEIDRGFGG